MNIGKLLVACALVSSIAACSKKEDKKTEGGGGGGGGGGEPKAAGFEPVAMEFGWRTWTDNRDMKFQIQAQVPKGWKLMTEGDNLKMLQTFMPGDTDPKTASMFSTPSLTFSATCNGQCVGAGIGANAAKLGKDRAAMHGASAKLLQDGELSPGVYGFVVEREGMKEGEKQYNVGVMHWNADWDSAVFCEAMLFGADGKRYKAFLDACATTKFEVIDAVVGADRMKQEEANLAKCPQSSTLTYTAKEPKPDEAVFDGVKAIQATASQVGAVGIKLASVPLTGDEWSDKALEAGQGVVEIWLGLGQGGPPDVLSGMYTNDGSTPLSVSIGLKAAGGVTYSVSSNVKGGVEVIARTRKRICGKIDVSDDWRSIKGEFVADFEVRD